MLSVAFSSDGTRIVSGSTDETMQIWDSQTGALLTEPFKGHDNWVNSVSFTPDNDYVVSGSSNRTIRIWDSLWTGKVEGGVRLIDTQNAEHDTNTNTLEFDKPEQYTSVAPPKNRDESASHVEMVDAGVDPFREVEIVSSKMVGV